MQSTNELLDQAKKVTNLPSDNALAQRMRITRAVISSWRAGRNPVPDERIAQLCALAKLDGPEWMARIHAERAESPAERQLWQTALQRLTAVAAALAVVVIAHRLNGPDGALSALMLPAITDHFMHYAKFAVLLASCALALRMHAQRLPQRHRAIA